jgi:hypothetical protein
MGLVTLGIQAIHANIPHWQTIAFTVLFSQMGHVMAIRSGRESL